MWGSPLQATPVATSWCSLKEANAMYGLRMSQTLTLQSTTRAQLAMWYFLCGLHLMWPTEAMVGIVYSRLGLLAKSQTWLHYSFEIELSNEFARSTLMVLSLEAVANQLISGCQSQAKIGPLCAVNCDRHLSCFLISQSCTFPFSDTAAKVCIWCGLNCTSRMLSVLLQKSNHFLVSGRTSMQLFCLEPEKIPCCFLYPQVKTFHGPILRARY